MFKVELVDAGSFVVGFFEVAHTIPLSSLAIKLEEAVKVHSAVAWQVLRPDNRILCQVKV